GLQETGALYAPQPAKKVDGEARVNQECVLFAGAGREPSWAVEKNVLLGVASSAVRAHVGVGQAESESSGGGKVAAAGAELVDQDLKFPRQEVSAGCHDGDTMVALICGRQSCRPICAFVHGDAAVSRYPGDADGVIATLVPNFGDDSAVAALARHDVVNGRLGVSEDVDTLMLSGILDGKQYGLKFRLGAAADVPCSAGDDPTPAWGDDHRCAVQTLTGWEPRSSRYLSAVSLRRLWGWLRLHCVAKLRSKVIASWAVHGGWSCGAGS
uniref:Subtilisin n=1 Tax=Macrostomum lignano TaxID=282301 RepID=A0A1I8FYL3_9PLAT